MKKKDKKHADNQTRKNVQQETNIKTEHAEPGNDHEETDDKAETSEKETETLSEITTLREQIDSLQKNLDEANDKFLRLFSEFDNYRKRVSKERVELTKTASESVILALLPVLDDLERAAIMAVKGSEAGNDVDKEGISLIYNKFKSILRQKGVEEITSVGEGFDTDFHDAITHIKAETEEQKGKIVEEVQKGYLLNGRVIRHARVIVAN
jgi:molecular chaperone GrpE